LRQKPYYGAVFFRGYNNKVKQQGAGFFDQDIEGTIVIGVNMEGLHVFSSQEAVNCSQSRKECSSLSLSFSLLKDRDLTNSFCLLCLEIVAYFFFQ
jgi:hypothetical protein